VRAAWWQERQDEVMDDFLMSLKTKVKPGLRGSRVMSGDWRRLHRVRGVFQWFTRKPLGSLVDPQSQDRRTEDGGAAALDRSDQCATTQIRDFEAEDMRRDCKACVEAKQVCGRWAFVQWIDDKDFRIRPRGACIPS
jgi:hypothetical protein